MRAQRLVPILFASMLAVCLGSQARAVETDILVTIDEAKIVRLKSPVSEIIIGNPSIADISVQNSKTLVVTGKSSGGTNMIVLDADGQQIMEAKLNVQANRSDIVTIQKGGLRQSFVCTPECQTTVAVGDSGDYFDLTQKQLQAKQSMGQSAAEGQGSQ